MTNNQCEAYGLLALTHVMRGRGYSITEVRKMRQEFQAELKGLFDFITEEEAEQRAEVLVHEG